MVISEDNGTKQEKPSEKHNSNPPHNKQENKKEKPSTKVIIRRLPPSMTQDEFLNQVSPIPDYDYIYTIKGDYSLGENAFARVYVNFSNLEDIYVFKEKFDNYVFVDGKGHEYAAVVEYSAFQKVPKRRRPRSDPKASTIESDPAYIEFLESLKEQPNQDEKPEYSYNLNQLSNDNKHDVTTPLLDYLKQRKLERMRQREEKRDERRKKEQERKKLREDDRRKRVEEKKQKNIALKESKREIKERDKDKDKDDSMVETKEAKEVKDAGESPKKPSASSTNETKRSEKSIKADKSTTDKYKSRQKFEDKKQKQNKFKYEDRGERNKEFKHRRDEFRDRERDRENYQRKYEEKRQEPKEQQKKVKKYSEKREERKIVEASKEEAKRAEAGKKEQKVEKEDKVLELDCRDGRSEDDEGDGKCRNKENDPRMQRRIRNKDRPTMQLYKPGMLRKKSVDNDKESSCTEKGDETDGKDKSFEE